MSDVEKLQRGKIPGRETGIEVRKSICTMCNPVSPCGLDLYVKDGEIVKIEGSKDNPRNEGGLCPLGATARHYVYHSERLKTPLKKNGRCSGDFEPVSWEEALDTIVNRLMDIKKDYGAESVFFYGLNEARVGPFLRRLAHAFGSPNYATDILNGRRAAAAAQKLVLGDVTVADLRNAGSILVWGSCSHFEDVFLMRDLLRARDRGARIIVVDPQRSPAAAISHVHLQPKPGSAVALALALAHEIICKKYYDLDFVNDYACGFEDLQEYIMAYSLEDAAGLAGVPTGLVREAAKVFAISKPGCVVFPSNPPAQHANGFETLCAVACLIALTGNYDVLGGNRVLSPVYSSVGKEVLAPRVGDDRFPTWSKLNDEALITHLPLQIQSGKPYPVKVLVAFGLNHKTWPDHDFVVETLRKLDFVVNVDMFWTESCEFADLVLPACSCVEQRQICIYPDNHILYTEAAIEPLHESRPDVDIIYDLAARLRLNDPIFAAGPEAGLNLMLRPTGLTLEILKRLPGCVRLYDLPVGSEREYRRSGFKTVSGKAELRSFLPKQILGSQRFKYEKEPLCSHCSTTDLTEEYPFVLSVEAHLAPYMCSAHSDWWLIPGCEPHSSKAFVSPADAAEAGLVEGDTVRVSTPVGSATARAALTRIVQPGTVHLSGRGDIGFLLDKNCVDPVSGCPSSKSLPCRIDTVGR